MTLSPPSRPPTAWGDEPVRLVPYDPRWPSRFDSESTLLAEAIGPWITGGIHHVGSTSVPGLAAKPIIDILVGVADLSGSRACIPLLEPLGYRYAPYRPDEMHWFCKPDPAHRTHHLHLVPTGSCRYRDELTFRDYLRAHLDVAAAYANLKAELAVCFRHDREAYTEGKSEFVADVLRAARTNSR